jgi:hypothetical protein
LVGLKECKFGLHHGGKDEHSIVLGASFWKSNGEGIKPRTHASKRSTRGIRRRCVQLLHIANHLIIIPRIAKIKHGIVIETRGTTTIVAFALAATQMKLEFIFGLFCLPITTSTGAIHDNGTWGIFGLHRTIHLNSGESKVN